MTAEITGRLSKLAQLTVVSTRSAARYVDTEKSFAEVGEELHVARILEGSVRRAGDQVRITTNLVDAASGRQLWSETYQRRLDDIFAVQSDVAEQIAAALRVELSAAEAAALARSGTSSLAAYEHYLKGVEHYGRYTRDDNERAMEQFERALAQDPDYSMALAGRARAHYQRGARFGFPPADAFESCLRDAERAVELDPSSAEAYVALGSAYNGLGRPKESLRAMLTAVELQPSHVSAVANGGVSLANVGRLEEAIVYFRRAAALDPLWVLSYSNAGLLYLQTGLDTEARRWMDRALELEPNDVTVRSTLSALFFFEGDSRRALELHEEILTELPDEPAGHVGAGVIHWVEGRHDRAEPHLRRAIDTSLEWGTESRIALAHIAWQRGEREEARALLEPLATFYGDIVARDPETLYAMYLAEIHAIQEEREAALERLAAGMRAAPTNLRWIERDPTFDALRSDPRYREIVDTAEARLAEARRRIREQESS
jgi:protein kinase/serine/threonine-protein kinase